ncbi:MULTISPECIES: HAD-IIB family hydrolase [unclassified Aureimonas]|uniref:HAD-IIB family hydrolase n=1 Tax=unclassified Aureimonas TaxID=2615206 RepID=UPI0006FD2622|nr:MULTISPECIES: HAD-IIB family hydrolase [unclassified Aureimonas]KQT68928.1 HAD family hydrolase [Aureimonas sp. Leaf460]KQT69155.1 HAD family hydrolase [Aureimonas sp. Leaf427]
MFVLHIALQGCLRARNVEYGVTADTGGHIRYLLDLVEASARDAATRRIVIATRRFSGRLGSDYAEPFERVGEKIEIVRLDTRSASYLEKEEMHGEVPSFAEALIAFIKAEDRRPDVIHAHYADAAVVAAMVEDRLGIPFVFTAHSLGRVKREALGADAAGVAGLDERIASEETALSRASLVIASSRDEAEVQWAGYEAYEPGHIRILPPGSDLQRFAGARTCPNVDASIDRFLTDSSKPTLLALARPVRKKNLAALVTAFGTSPDLRRAANLVIVAGTREDYADLDGDMAETVGELLHLIDRYDLYGSVAYPKTHRPEEVPAIYAYARERRGVFVNTALNEPFGLTLLEAAAVGLPLIATDSGGPNDIIEMCGNGILVDPRSPDALVAAALRILGDPALWDRYAKAGAKAAGAYDWTRHAGRYHGLLGQLLDRVPPAADPKQLLISDIDNTLVGCSDAIRTFGEWRKEQDGLAFGVATGRSFHSAMAILEQQDAPRPQVMITSVGSEIYHLDANGTTYSQDRDWRAVVSRNWNREAAREALATVAGILPQAPLEQRSHKLSYFSDGSPGTVRRIQAALELAGLRCSVIHSHGRYLDILPLRASKGTAVAFVRKHYGLGEDAVFVAGDSGNDIEMLRTIPQAIIVANFSDDLAGLPALSHSYVARRTHALGIIEGVHHFRERALAAAACKPVS